MSVFRAIRLNWVRVSEGRLWSSKHDSDAPVNISYDFSLEIIGKALSLLICLWLFVFPALA